MRLSPGGLVTIAFLASATVRGPLQSAAIAQSSDGFPASNYLVARGDAAFVDRLYGGTVEFSRDGNGTVNGLLWKLSASYRARSD